MGRLVWGALVIVVLAAGASAKDDEFNVDLAIGWGSCYRPSQWTPVEVNITRQAKDPFGGAVTLSAMQDAMTSMSISHPIVVAKDQPARLPLVTKLSLGATRCDLSITDDKGRTRWSLEYDLGRVYQNSRPYTAVYGRDILIGVSGQRPLGLLRLPRNSISLPAESGSSNGGVSAVGKGVNHSPPDYGGNSGKVYVKDKLVEQLPWDWTGYVSLDALILCNVEWDRINLQQAKAINQWVSNGGRLLLVVGARPLPDKGPIAQMLPFRLANLKKSPMPRRFLPAKAGPEDATQPADSTLLAGQGAAVRQGDGMSSPRGDAGASLTHWSLDQAPGAGWTTDSFGGEESLLACSQVGFGKVAVLAFDPADLPSADALKSAEFWTDCLKGILDVHKIEVVKNPPESDNNYWSDNSSPSSGSTDAVMEHLLSIPELRPLSIWWVIGLLGLLAVLLGPVDYLVLKRLDRLPLTWITSAVVIAVFTVGAYYGVKALRAGDMQVRAVSVIDSIRGGNIWGTTFCGIFAPDSDDYRLSQTGPTQWWSGVSPGQNYGYYEESFSSRKIYFLQQDGRNTPWSVPINIWSMQCLLAESDVPRSPISAQVVEAGEGVSLKITNNGSTPVRGITLMDGTGRIRLGPLDVGKSTSVPLIKTSSSLTLGGDGKHVEFLRKRGRFPDETNERTAMAMEAQGCDQRSRSIAEYIRNGAIVVQAEFEAAPLPFGMADRKYEVNHVLFARLVIPAKELTTSK